MDSDKKGQIAGQVFIYVLAALIFGLILLFGYRAIADMKSKAQQVELVELKSSLTKSINSIKTTADVKKKTITLPTGYDQICFIDLKKPPNTGVNDLIYDSWQDNVEQNVFLVPHSDFRMYIGDIEIDNPGYLCLHEVGGRVTIRLEGKGSRTLISEWT